MNEIDKNSIIALSDGTLVNCVAEVDSGLTVERSMDGGATWDATTVPEADKCWGITAGPKDEVYMLTLAGVLASFDGGVTWDQYARFNEPYTINEPRASPKNAESRVPGTPGTPSVAVSPSTGTVLYASPRWDADTETWDSVLYRSVDRGESFDEIPAPIASSPTCAECHVVYPLLTADPDGRFALQYALLSDYGHRREIWITASLDDGGSWLPAILTGETDHNYDTATMYLPRDPTAAEGTASYYARNPMDAHSAIWPVVLTAVRDDHWRWGGDYWSITYTDDGFLSMWVEHDSEGTPQLWTRPVVIQGD